MAKVIVTPLTAEVIDNLRTGDKVLFNGTIYTGRDAAHKRLVEMLTQGEQLPFDPLGQVIYYVGPCPARPGAVIGSAGPTTSGRMDPYTPLLLKAGLKGMIGKGLRSEGVIDAIKRYGAVYFVTTGGAGALLAERIKAAELVAFPDLGPEAIYKLQVENFPAIVAIDRQGNDIYRIGRELYRVKTQK